MHPHQPLKQEQQRQRQQQQQHRMAGNPHTGALPRDEQQHPQQIQHRRALMQQQHIQQQGLLPSPYATNPMQHQPHHHHQQQQQQHHHHQQQQQQQSQSHTSPSYLAMNANLGLTMTMNDMRSSIRAYHPMQQQQHMGPAPPDSSNVYWRPAGGMAADPAAYGKPSGLEMEFNDILAQTADSGSGGGGPVPGAFESSSSSSHTQRTSDVSMTSMNASFDVFGDHPGVSSSSSLKPSYPMPSQLVLRARISPRDATPVSAVVSVLSPPTFAGARSDLDTADLVRPRRSSSVASTASGGGHDSNVSESSITSIASSTASAAPTDYSQFVEAREEPDLRQQKLDTKSETCQFHNCPNRARVVQAYGKFCNRHVIVAPCGFPGCRDRANVHASMCEKHLAEGKEALHRVLANRAQNVPVCRTFGCFKNDQGRGYCRGHEKLLMATGRLPKHINKRRLNSAYTMCSYPGCNKHSQRHHLCRTHGNLIAKQAEELHARSTTGETYDEVLARLQKDVRKCTHPSCTKNSQRDRLCTIHYYEKHNLQRDGSSGPSTSAEATCASEGAEATERIRAAGADTACSVADCGALATGKGMCQFHATTDPSSSIGTAALSGAKSPGLGSSGASGGSASGIRAVERTRCSVVGCGQVSYASGLCMAHLKQQQVHAPGSAMATGRYSSALSSFSDDRFSVSMVDGAASGRSGIDSSYFASGSHASAYSGSLDPSGVAANYAVVGPLGRQHVGGAAPTTALSSDHHHHQQEQHQGRPYTAPHPSSNVSGGMARTSAGAACSNPMCARDAFGREYCESCQSMFAPLVVSVGDSLANTHAPASYSYASSSAQPEPENSPQAWTSSSSATVSSSHAKRSAAAVAGPALAGKGISACRVSGCSASGLHGGLCEQHFRSFEDGGLSVDELTLRSRQMAEQQQQIQQSQLAASKSSPGDSSKLRKYFCKFDGCGKQAQRRGLCKRHYRQHEDAAGNAMPSTGAPLASAVASALTCRFPGCTQPVGGHSAALCLGHANASACWQPGCEVIVDGPQFCESHALHQQCAYEGCSFPALRDGGGGCSHHMMERRCSHAHCEKFTVGAGDRCRLHQISCSEEPCALCGLHGLEPEPSALTGRMVPPPGSHPPMLQPLAFASASSMESRRANAENFHSNSSSSDTSVSYRDARMF